MNIIIDLTEDGYIRKNQLSCQNYFFQLNKQGYGQGFITAVTSVIVAIYRELPTNIPHKF